MAASQQVMHSRARTFELVTSIGDVAFLTATKFMGDGKRACCGQALMQKCPNSISRKVRFGGAVSWVLLPLHLPPCVTTSGNAQGPVNQAETPQLRAAHAPPELDRARPGLRATF